MIFWDAVTHHQNRHHLPDELPPASAPFTSRPFTSKVSRLMSFLPGRKRRESWLIMVNHGYVRQVVGLDFRKFAWDLNGCLYGIGWDFFFHKHPLASSNASFGRNGNQRKKVWIFQPCFITAGEPLKKRVHPWHRGRTSHKNIWPSGPPAIKRS